MKPARARVELPVTKELPRKLIIGWDGDDCSVHIHAHAFIRGRSVAFGAAHAVNEAHLSYASGLPVLWLRSAQFELTTTEAAEVERVFAPLGLSVVRDGMQS